MSILTGYFAFVIPRCRFFLWLIFVTLTVFFVPSRSEANEAEIRDLLIQFGDKKSSVRKSALIGLAEYEDERLVSLLDAYKLRQLFMWNNEQIVLCKEVQDGVAYLQDPLTGKKLQDLSNNRQYQVPITDLKAIRPARPERNLAENVKSLLKLFSSNFDARFSGVKKCGETRTIKALGQLNDLALRKLESLSKEDADKKIRRVAQESALLIQIHQTPLKMDLGRHLAIVQQLGLTKSMRVQKYLERTLKTIEKEKDTDPQAQKTYGKAIRKIETYQGRIAFLSNLFQGISLSSVLILMALGLAVTFGLMGVINMAHGELMMIGAYTTFEMQKLFNHTIEDSNNWYYVFALPASFLVAAFVGFLIEILVVRHLYKRPLESLLATWGIGLILIQAVRLRYGDNIGVNAPTWGRGGIEVIQDFVLPYGRCFIIVLCTLSVLSIYYLMRYTELGLKMRATMQNRDMASSLGVNTNFVDRYTFAFGSGIAGIAGYAWTLVGGVTPDMGQTNFIVDSFLVVVTGGVGEIIGVVCSGLGIGGITKAIEPTIGTIWAKILLLVAVVVFIQFKPSGLFAPKGRLADD
ncbi:TPA: urea ABC transporter permease subunit UrtB [Candidatus Poribacteria bacterium]|nr:urea ABC transporter permease subunit UrtB [Candidatus Poribacteria bacterium]HIC02695.1 urea ABC transporter permease subunit UrtB [Candidatus Poribacteria bacterium]HIM12122.1 urea ABC transporter permease subunit UrtB [Candidatus Poribacteria bacterium]HIO47090.1 urea ABC transporter permease subunit UrtB [Candidatus Poribacteria bacterium]HIO79661.1 urea ABC transporter permease subunit UrtB [Candidatus Poribacteria bacterium]